MIIGTRYERTTLKFGGSPERYVITRWDEDDHFQTTSNQIAVIPNFHDSMNLMCELERVQIHRETYLEKLFQGSDLNKNQLTRDVTIATMRWLYRNGFHIIVPECRYGDNDLIADLMGWCEPYYWSSYELGFITHKEAMELKRQTADAGYKQGLVGMKAWKYGEQQWFKALDDVLGSSVIGIIEVKTSRADFLKDVKKKFSALYATTNIIAYPHKLISVDEIPDGWLGIETTQDGGKVYRIHFDHFRVNRIDSDTTLLYANRILHRFPQWLDYSASAFRVLHEPHGEQS